MSKVVGIKSHPKYKDAAALRVWLNEGGQDNFGTTVDMTRFIDSDNPEVQAMLADLNSWCESLKDLPPGQPPAAPSLLEMSKLAKIVDKYAPGEFGEVRVLDWDGPRIDMEPHLVKNLIPTPNIFIPECLKGGLKKGEFYNFGAVVPPSFSTHTYLNNEFVKKEPTDANPST